MKTPKPLVQTKALESSSVKPSEKSKSGTSRKRKPEALKSLEVASEVPSDPNHSTPGDISAPISSPECQIESKGSGPQEDAPKRLVIEAAVDVGFGNDLYIRGQGAGLSWESGIRLSCLNGSLWVWECSGQGEEVEFKLLLNDRQWSTGGNVQAQVPGKVSLVPQFG